MPTTESVTMHEQLGITLPELYEAVRTAVEKGARVELKPGVTIAHSLTDIGVFSIREADGRTTEHSAGTLGVTVIARGSIREVKILR